MASGGRDGTGGGGRRRGGRGGAGCFGAGQVRRAAATIVAAVALGGCGGGVWFGIGDDDDPPTVALAASLTVARPGEIVTLVAAASDDFGIDHVAFYRVDPNTGVGTLIARDLEAPYRLDVAMPSSGATEVRFFARAVDDVGQQGDSAVVSVAVNGP